MKIFSTLIIAMISLFSVTLSAQTWVGISTDPVGDGFNPNLMDASNLEYYYDVVSDSLWFRFTLDTINSTHQANFGFNVMVNIPNGGDKFNFWGTDNMNAFHKLITVWVAGVPPFVIGIADSAGVSIADYTNLHADNISIDFDLPNNQVVLGMERQDLITDLEFPGNVMTFDVAGASGSSSSWNDDVYSANGSMTLDKTPAGIDNSISSSLITVYPQPASEILVIDLEELSSAVERIEISSVDGKSVAAYDVITTNRMSIPVNTLAAGSYILSVYLQNSVVSKKILVD